MKASRIKSEPLRQTDAADAMLAVISAHDILDEALVRLCNAFVESGQKPEARIAAEMIMNTVTRMSILEQINSIP